jgi:hypothetical protein
MPHYANAMRPQEVNDYEDAEVHRNADRVFCIFDKEQVETDSVRIGARSLRAGYVDDPSIVNGDQPFAEQPVAKYRYGTAFLVAREIVATAKHVLEAIEPNVTEGRFVRRFEKGTDRSYHFRDVYAGVQVLEQAEGDLEEDWALVRIDGSPPGLAPVTMDLIAPAIGTAVYCIGHPMGLSAKLVFGKVTSAENGKYGVRMDAFSGNSGSPVFRVDTHALVGLLSAGGTDYEDGTVAIVGSDDDGTETVVSSIPMFRALARYLR